MATENLEQINRKQLKEDIDSELDTTICNLVVKKMFQHPEKTAIIDGVTEIDYHQLIQMANQVAGELIHRDIKPGALIGVCMNRNWKLVATLLGIMQAGCAYVPLDPAYPEERIQYMLQHSQATAVFVDNEQVAALCQPVQELIWIDKVGEHSFSQILPSAYDLAYVIYTSGSTGKPKGVAVEHRNIVEMSHAVRDKFSDEELQGVFAGASVCFDTSVMEIMGTLSLGGTIILAKNALELTTLPAKDQIKTCVIVASAMQALLATETLPQNLQCLVFGGEALKRSLVEQVYALRPGLRILNAYGPTEDTVYSTISEITPDNETVSIGTSVPGSRSYILDDNLQPVPNGEPGELYLAGTKLARGYLYDEAKTKERFIEIIPNDQITDNRLYRTGDLCRRLANDEIEFLGRVDQQVKIRGYRIELEEIESTLESMEGIDAAAAAAVEGSIGQKILVVYIVSRDTSITEEKVKSYLSQRLPKYMVPQVIRNLNALPLLPNDKLDRKKLKTLEEEIRSKQQASTIEDHKTSSQKYLNVIQTELAALLNLQNIEQIEPECSFENLGLDSLTTLEFSSRLSQILGQEVSANAIFKYATPIDLANYITNSKEKGLNEKTEHEYTINTINSLATFQTNIQSSHPTFQAAKVNTWNVNDKSILVQEVMRMVNDNRRNPYSKVLRTGSATRGIVGDAYNDEEKEAIIWTTNLYLGLNRDPQVMEQASKALAQFGTGMGTSAAASGMTNQHLEFETEFADLVGKESACLFPTGYTANVGAVAGLLGKNDVVIIDQLCHASIVDGARLCGAKVRTFKHNSASDLEAVLQSEVSPYRSILVVLEGVYSMGEGAAPVAEIVRTAKKYNALVLVDEAHSFGFYGEGGAGICAEQGVTEQVDFIMTTLSKALGSLGGVVAASQKHVDLLKSSSRAYIFQASVSPADMAAALTSLRRLRSDDGLRERLWDTTRYMRRSFEAAGYDLGTGDGPIVTPHFSDKDKLYAIVQSLYQKGVQTSAVTYPIVEPGRGRLRFICSAAHTKDDVDKTLQALIEAEQEVDVQLKEIRGVQKNLEVSESNIKEWAQEFTEFLKDSVNENFIPTPDLAISIGTDKAEELVSIIYENGEISLSTKRPCTIPYAKLTIKDAPALKALKASDIQAILHNITTNSFKLEGQVEPFTWFVARVVEYKNVLKHETVM